ncbi:MAG TPA: lysophospholipid acyltransferase family protein [Smithellaceae bacterium]|jgi:1-acyl-sn-glycerol-3-phosphate acyltransferase|nr:1-acyl-sn-glycerol-3-phosphate acyltransferase [Smithella sp.]HOG81170.1 lysophospholipid acyltransferase family protein [Smithellaceae bacterium]HRY35387.1 lysophospholipid acyltransferase family protein [Smithellaceae bacterium]
MDARSRLWLQLQNILGRLGFIFLAPFYFLMIHLLHYRIRNLRELRRQCAMEFDSHRGPWIICANHLTMIDSFLLSYSLFGFVRHFTHFGQIPWNLPERSNFQSNIFLAVICYLSKCIPVDRGGSRVKMKKTLDQCTYLLRHGHAVMIFPEGGRSRTGRVDKDNFSYGVGRFIKDVGECKVMCVYLRGDTQQQYSMIPAWGDRFHVRMEVFKPVPVAVEGLRAQREYAAQVIERLVLMEEKYFAIHRERYCGFGPSAERSKKHGFALSEENSHRY